MKVLMVLDEEFPPDVRVEKEIKALSQAGHQVHLLCYSRSGKSGQETVSDVLVFRVPISPITYKMKALALLLPFYFSFWKKIIQHHLDKETYELIHFHDLPLTSVCLELARKNGLKIIGDYHENRPEIMKLYHHVNSFPGKLLISVKDWQKFQIKYAGSLDQLILVTPEARDYYATNYRLPENKITVVENFPDTEELMKLPFQEKILEKYKNLRVILYFGDTGTRRGTINILEAAREFQDSESIRFVIIGSSREQDHLLSLKEKYKLDNVEFTGEIPLSEAVSYFKSSWIGLCPFLRNIHHDTTYANKMFQYMAFGLPIVVSDCTAQANVIRESDAGLVHEAGNTKDMVDKIKMLLDDEKYTKMSKNAVDWVHKKYNFDNSKRKLITLYNKLG